MSKRISITKAIAEKLKLIDGTAPYTSNLYGNVFAKLKFWDEVEDFPCVYMTPGQETREYHPGEFKWAFLSIALKIYTRGDQAQEELEALIEDVETCLDTQQGCVVYDTTNNYQTSEYSITSITTDEGLLAPYAVGEINILVRYQVM